MKTEKKTTKAPPQRKKAAPKIPKKVEPTTEKGSHKIDDVEFWAAMYMGYGIISRVIKVIKRDHGVSMSRQAIHERAKKEPEKLNECREIIIDAAEETLLELMMTGDKKTRADMAKTVVKTLGKTRGYVEKTETEHSGELTVTSVTVEHVSTGVPFASSEKEIS